MNPNTNEPMNRTTLYVVLIIIVVLLIGAIFASRAHAPSTEPTLPVTDVSTSTIGGLNLGSSTISSASSTLAGGAVTSGSNTASTTAKNATFTNPGWSIAFTLRPQWNVNEILNGDPTKGTGSLHQMIISDNQTVIFVSQNEAIAVSGDLASTTSTQNIAGQSVTVRTYTQPSAQFAFYKLFTLKESDATYSFLIKSAVADTSITDAFIRSISHT